MIYIASTNEVGCETFLARSSDLLHWEKLGNILSFPPKGWDRWQRAGYVALCDLAWGGSNELESFDGKYWVSSSKPLPQRLPHLKRMEAKYVNMWD